MLATFRSDLTCSREEQQGVVFYRVDDPKAQTSFRLYEIEYLIAQKLDGKRALLEVIEAVKAEHHFDISEPDLKKFIGQLESMGFLASDANAEGGAPAGDVDPDATKVMARPTADGASPGAGGPGLVEEEPAAKVDEAELRRLLKSAFLHVRQGYIVHARDYFLAARELNPHDPRIGKLVSNVEIMSDASGPSEIEFLWTQARELYPEIAEEVGPLVEAQSTSSTKVAAAAKRTVQAWDADLKARLLWLAVAIVAVGGGGGGLYYFARATHVFEGAAKATVATMRAQRVPIYFDKPAEAVQAARETWLKFVGGGKVDDVKVVVGARVAVDQVLVSLELAEPAKKALDAARSARDKAQAEYDKTAAKLGELTGQREALEAERTGADAHLDELKPKNVLTAGGASKRDLEKWKKVKAKVNKSLSALAKKERQPKAAEAKAKKKLDDIKKKLAAIEARIGQKLIRAPFAGVVVDMKVTKGQTVTAEQNILLLRDTLEARLSFTVKDAGTLASGGEAFVAVARGVPGRAKVITLQAAGDGKKVEVNLADPAGSFVDMAPTEFRLVREFAEPAFQVPVTALFADERGSHLLVELQGRALLRDVEVLSHDAANAVVRDRSGALRDGEHLVVQRVGEGGVGSIVDGSFLEIQN
jgi:multidrug efflux pump subunit AcrA (membrane-fusion protein)